MTPSVVSRMAAVVAMFVLPATGFGDTLKLNPPLVSGGNVTNHRVSPDGTRVLYRADQDTDEVFELFSVPLTGGPSTKLSGPMVNGGDVEPILEIAPNGIRVIYFADQEEDEVVELYSVPIDGSAAPVKLNGSLVSDGDVSTFAVEIAPDSSRVVYLADQEVDGREEIYSRFLDGSGLSTKLNGPLVTNGNVLSFRVSPDSSSVVYRASQDNEFADELYSRPIDGSGTFAKINEAGVPGGDVDFLYSISSDSSRVVYRSDLEVDQRLELYSRPLDGSGLQVKLNDPLAPDGGVGTFRISPDGTQVVYSAEQDTQDTLEVYNRPIDGSGSPLKLSGALVSGRSAFLDDITPDGSHVVYLADQDVEDVLEAFSVPIDGSSTAIKLNGPIVSGGEVIGGQITFDSQRYVYFADLDTAGLVEIYSSRLDTGGISVKLNDTTGNSVGAFGQSPDSEIIVYLEGNIFAGLGLFAVPTGGGSVMPVNDPLVPGGSIFGLSEISASDDRTVIYRAEQDTLGVIELYAAAPDTDGDGVPDNLDNCAQVANMDQRDTNGDDFGNSCDPDLNNDCIVDFADLPFFQSAFFSSPGDGNWNPDADLTGDDVVDFADLPTAQSLFFGPPGPNSTGTCP